MRRRDFYVLGESELGAVGKGGLFRGTTEAGGDERWSNEVAQRSSVLIFSLHLRTESYRDVFTSTNGQKSLEAALVGSG